MSAPLWLQEGVCLTTLAVLWLIWALARAQTPSCDRLYPSYHLLFTACKNIHPFKSYAHICEHLPGPYYRDCRVDYIIKTLASVRGGFASEASKTTAGGGPKGRRKPQVRRNEVSAVEFASVYYIKFVKLAKIPILELQKMYVPYKLKSPKFVQTIIYHRRNINQNLVNFRWTV